MVRGNYSTSSATRGGHLVRLGHPRGPNRGQRDRTRRIYGIEWFSDDGSIIRHNTLVWHPNGGKIDITSKTVDPPGQGTQVYDNVAVVQVGRASVARNDHNISGQSVTDVALAPTRATASLRVDRQGRRLGRARRRHPLTRGDERRQFTAPNDEMILATLGATLVSGLSAGTIAAVVKLDDVTNLKVILAVGNGGKNYTFFIDGAESLGYFDSTISRHSPTGMVTTGIWYLVAMTKAAGTVTTRFHVYNYNTDTWDHRTRPMEPPPTSARSLPTTGGRSGNGSTGAGWNGAIQARRIGTPRSRTRTSRRCIRRRRRGRRSRPRRFGR